MHPARRDRLGQFTGRDQRPLILLLARLQVLDYLRHQQILIQRAHLRPRLIRAEPARRTPADVVFAEKRALRSR